ncbi:MAG: hypothetical protein MI717_03685 [Spirochaetales bacterium]|nr:hypothetical protein [Spirochaetales bacterium]
MRSTRKSLVTEARRIRQSLEGLTEQEIQALLGEVIRCNDPFVTTEEIHHVLYHSEENSWNEKE